MKPSQIWAPLQVGPEVNMSSFELQWPDGGYTVCSAASAKRVMKSGRKTMGSSQHFSLALFQRQLLEVASLNSTVHQLLHKRLWVKLPRGISLTDF